MDEINVMGITIKRNGSPESPTSEQPCWYLANGACEECSCDKCTRGIIVNRENGSARDCSCKTEAINRLRAKRAGLPAGKTFETYRTPEPWQRLVKSKALAFISDKTAKGFYIGGQSGSGKTHICSAIAGEMMKRGKTVEPFRWVNQGRTMKALASEPEYDETLAKYINADILFIDDFLKTETVADVRLAMQLVDERYNRQRTTVISSERTLAEIAKLCDGEGEAIAGRIKEMCGEYCVMLSGKEKNQRLKG